jgi:hypothetical protein
MVPGRRQPKERGSTMSAELKQKIKGLHQKLEDLRGYL